MKMLHSIFSFMSILACLNGLGGFSMFLSFVYVLGTTHLKECLVVAGTTAHKLLALLVASSSSTSSASSFVAVCSGTISCSS